MFTTKMIRLFAVVLGRDSEKVTEELLRAGVMQFINISEIGGSETEKLNVINTSEYLAEITETRKRIEGFLHPLGIYPETPKEIDLNNRTPITLQEYNLELDKLNKERERIREKQRIIQHDILKYEDIKRQVELYSSNISDLTLSTQHSFISMQIGTIATKLVPALENEIKEIPSVNLTLGEEGETSHLLIITMKRDSKRVDEVLNRVGWNRVELPRELQNLKSDITEDLTEKLTKLQNEQKSLGDSLNNLVKEKSSWLKEIWILLRINELMNRIQTYFKQSSRTILFSGWLPSAKKQLLSKNIREASGGRCYLEWFEAEEKMAPGETIPVEFKNPKLFKPFEMLVANFGVPEYGTIDPTVFVMPLYLIMFGIMFADVGQGAVLALLGYLGTRFFKTKNSDGLMNLSNLLVWCGSFSILFGILFGSYFGTGLFRPLWFDFHGIVVGHSSSDSPIQDIFDILQITIFFGVFVIILGLIFNWINLIRKRDWLELIFAKGGILGGWIYCSGVYLGYSMAVNNYQIPDPALLFWLAGIPALLLFVKEPIHFFQHKTTPLTPLTLMVKSAEFLMNWGVELLEIFSGYLSNTLSFMRVAGLGIAHVSLMVSFFALAEMAGGKGIAALLILVAGNILVIILEGLSAGIQALRLNYYEFFTKFFHGTGKLYSPVSLSSHDS